MDFGPYSQAAWTWAVASFTSWCAFWNDHPRTCLKAAGQAAAVCSGAAPQFALPVLGPLAVNWGWLLLGSCIGTVLTLVIFVVAGSLRRAPTIAALAKQAHAPRRRALSQSRSEDGGSPRLPNHAWEKQQSGISLACSIDSDEIGERTPEEKEIAKEALRKTFKVFMKAAKGGQPCHWLDPVGRAKPQECIYMFPESLSVFTAQAKGNTLQSFEILNMEDVSKDSAGTPFEDFWGTGLVCISIKGDGSAGSPALQHIGLLFPDAKKQDEFCTCMKLVRKMRQVLSVNTSPAASPAASPEGEGEASTSVMKKGNEEASTKKRKNKGGGSKS